MSNLYVAFAGQAAHGSRQLEVHEQQRQLAGLKAARREQRLGREGFVSEEGEQPLFLIGQRERLALRLGRAACPDPT